MKKLTSVALSLALPAMASTALAGGGPPPPPAGKADILHCGCATNDWGYAQLNWNVLQVSLKTKGHQQHKAGDVETCYDDWGNPHWYTRGGDDCQLAGAAQVAGLSQCWPLLGYSSDGHSCATDQD